MKIERAIELLQREKESGTKSIVLAYWCSDTFSREDDELWETDSDNLEHYMDWSDSHDQMVDLLSQWEEN